ncbi:hypothetical protein [Clostridium tagluense]|nr:hypothetical protein [Clostridium tagluense]
MDDKNVKKCSDNVKNFEHILEEDLKVLECEVVDVAFTAHEAGRH